MKTNKPTNQQTNKPTNQQTNKPKITLLLESFTLLNGYDLTGGERHDVDYLGDPTDHLVWEQYTSRFFRYDNELFDLNEFMRVKPEGPDTLPSEYGVGPNSPLLEWDGVQVGHPTLVVKILIDEDEPAIKLGALK